MDETTDINLSDRWLQLTNGSEQESVVIQVRMGTVFLRKSASEPTDDSACHPISGVWICNTKIPIWLRAAATALVTVS